MRCIHAPEEKLELVRCYMRRKVGSGQQGFDFQFSDNHNLGQSFEKLQISYIITIVCLSVCACVRPTRQFRVLMHRRNWPGRSDSENRIRPGQSDSENGNLGPRVPGFGKMGGQTGQGGARGRAGSIYPSVLQGRAGGRAVREGQGPNKE
jgi:hypothetical protein